MPLEERSGRKGTTSNSHVEIGAVGGGVRADVLYNNEFIYASLVAHV